MPVFSALIEQLKQLWSRWSIAQRFGISTAAVMVVGVVIATFFWATREEYTIIATDLTPTDSAKIMDALDDRGIAARINFSGTTVSVPQGSYSTARSIIADIEDLSTGDFAQDEQESMGLLPGSPRAEEDSRRRRLEQSIASTIRGYKGVNTAKVHLTLPRESVFVDEQIPATASVVLEMKKGHYLRESLANAIISAVARAVPKLKVEDIVLTDTEGRVYEQGAPGKISTEQLIDTQRKMEDLLVAKLSEILTKRFGADNFAAQVSIDLNRDKVVRRASNPNPEGKTLKSENTTTNKTQESTAAPAGPVGTDPNLQNDPLLTGETQSDTTSETVTNEYVVPMEEEETIVEPGGIRRITASVIVDPSSLAPASATNAAGAAGAAGGTGAAANGGATAATVTRQDIEEIVKNVIGIDETRADQVTVMIQPLAKVTEEPIVVPPAFNWREYEHLIQSGALAMASLLAFITGLLLLRKMKPVVVPAPQEEPISIADMQRIRDLSEQAKAHPEVFASILEAWLRNTPAEPQKPPATSGRTDRKAA